MREDVVRNISSLYFLPPGKLFLDRLCSFLVRSGFRTASFATFGHDSGLWKTGPIFMRTYDTLHRPQCTMFTSYGHVFCKSHFAGSCRASAYEPTVTVYGLFNPRARYTTALSQGLLCRITLMVSYLHRVFLKCNVFGHVLRHTQKL